jgi:uncharacterized protein YkwD
MPTAPVTRLLLPAFAAVLVGLPAAFLLIGAARPDAATREPAPVVRGGNSLGGFALLAWPTSVPTATPQPTPTAEAAHVRPARVAAPADPAPPAPPPPPPPAPPAQWPDAAFAASVLAGVNGERAKASLPPLSANGALSSTAQAYSLAVLELGHLSHSADGRDTSARAAGAGYAGPGPVGESLWSGTGPFGPEQAVYDWMGSPAHRAMLLNPAYLEAGIGCYFHDGGPKAVCDLILVG